MHQQERTRTTTPCLLHQVYILQGKLLRTTGQEKSLMDDTHGTSKRLSLLHPSWAEN